MRDLTGDSPRRRGLWGLGTMLLSIAFVAALPAPSGSPSVRLVVALTVGVLILDFFDLSLPHGDRIGLDGPLVAAGLLTLSPLLVMIVSLLARAAAQVLTRRGKVYDSVVDLGTTALGVAAAGASMSALRAFVPPAAYSEYVAVGVACSVLLIVQLLYSQSFSALRLSRPFGGLLRGNVRFQGPLLLAEVSTAVLLVMTYEQMGIWSVALSLVLLLLLRHSYALLIDVRSTYMNTVEVLVETAESADPGRLGHGERTASVARDIAEEMGLSSSALERISYAALLHDLDLVSMDPGEWPGDQHRRRQAGQVLAQVGFLSDVVPLLSILDGDTPAIEKSTPEQRLQALIIALSSEIDTSDDLPPAVGGGEVAAVAALVSASDKAKAISATIRLGYPVPALP